MTLKFKILGIPQAKQSARFRAVKMGEKTFVQSYQKKEVVENERNIAYDIKSQLPEGFVPFNQAVCISSVTFVFPYLASFTKRRVYDIITGTGQAKYKITKPDLQDNLMKGLIDAMKGVVFVDDSLVCKMGGSEKIYGPVPMTLIELTTDF